MRSRSMLPASVAATTVAAMYFLVAKPAAQQFTYNFTPIADVTDCSGGVAAPVINSSGEVAFLGHWCGNSFVIRRGDGGALTTIHDYQAATAGYVPDQTISINDSGTVAFRARDSQSARQVILVGSGGGVTPVVDTTIHTQYKDILLPVINASGAVAFMADTDGSQGYDSVVVVNNGSFVTIAGPGTASQLGPLVFAAYAGRMNSSGVVTFLGQSASSPGVFTGSGGPLTLIASGGAESTINSINTAGRVSFAGHWNGHKTVQTGDGTGTTPIASYADGYLNLNETAINDSGHVVFSAMLQSGQTGIFKGPDPDTDAVIKSGAVLQGLGRVTFVWPVSAEALNNAGQVAFGVTYDNGPDTPTRHAIVRADPQNRPPVASSATAAVTAGASVSDTLTATDPDGDALTYAIVTTGSKGTAVVTNAATGAYTYTANTGTSGTDTFTFQVTDSHGATSNLATVTVTIQPPPTCAVNVTGSVSVTPGSFRQNRKTGHYTQKVTLKNTSAGAIAGPISFVLDSLSSGTTLVNAAGATACAAPAGSPYVNVNVGSDSLLSVRERANVDLEFTLEFTSSGPITYTPRVLAGSGGR